MSQDIVTPESVDGVPASSVAAPRSVRELSELLAEGAASNHAVVFRTAGTKLDWGQPPARLDTIVDLSALPAEIDHTAGDLVVRVSASVGLGALNEALAVAGQRLAVDEVVPGSSVGGVIATGLSGPLRFGFGSVRDLLIGISVVRADGVVAKSGGRVVKNVAGYDLGKLFTGSFGTLGAITSAYFRLHPLPETRGYLSFSFASEADAGAALRRLAASQSAAAAIELERRGDGPITVMVLLEGSPRSVAARGAELLAGSGQRPELSAEAPRGFGELPGAATVKLTFAPGGVAAVLLGLSALLGGDERNVLRGAAAVGVLYVGLPPDRELSGLLSGLRALAARAGGAATLLRAPRARRLGLDVWGGPPAPALQRAVKASFDPLARLAPGRFVGGL